MLDFMKLSRKEDDLRYNAQQRAQEEARREARKEARKEESEQEKTRVQVGYTHTVLVHLVCEY